MKKPMHQNTPRKYIKYIVFLCLIVFSFFYFIINNPNIIFRINKKEYSKNITVQCYLISENQIELFFKDPKNFIQTSIENIFEKNARDEQKYLLTAIANKGEYCIWGKINIYLNQKQIFSFTTDLLINLMNHPNYYLHPIGNRINPLMQGQPMISTEWDYVCSK